MAFQMTCTSADGVEVQTWESLLEFFGDVEMTLGYLSQFPVDPKYSTDGEWDAVKLAAVDKAPEWFLRDEGY